MVKCVNCNKKIKGRAALLDTKPHCSGCYEEIRWKRKHPRSIYKKKSFLENIYLKQWFVSSKNLNNSNTKNIK